MTHWSVTEVVFQEKPSKLREGKRIRGLASEGTDRVTGICGHVEFGV